MKKLFNAIRSKDFETVKQLIDRKPELVNCTAKQPPKKDDGQSPLQIALKTGAFDIADFLIDRGADLNFMEDAACCNTWRVPVIHDAINAAVMCSRWNTNDPFMGFEVYSTEEKANAARKILEKMLQSGSDINKPDSAGNSGIWRFCLQANQILPKFDMANNCESDDRIFTSELESDLLAILQLLCKYGADMSYVPPNRGSTVKEFYPNGSMAKLLKQVF
ncbi:MAG: ankyrin repeat domain-containing protein [Christensenellaceae bacterium]|nr:ankyrin repeat domain-containing protein [Christensenellaceae bacterium]